jgi:hypothetical protein
MGALNYGLDRALLPLPAHLGDAGLPTFEVHEITPRTAAIGPAPVTFHFERAVAR